MLDLSGKETEEKKYSIQDVLRILEAQEKGKIQPQSQPTLRERLKLDIPENMRKYIVEQGFTKELIVFEFDFHEGMINKATYKPTDKVIIVREYDFFQDEFPCLNGKCEGSHENIYFRYFYGTPTLSCIFCRTSRGLSFAKRGANRTYKVTADEAEKICREHMNMRTEEISIMCKYIFGLQNLKLKAPRKKRRRAKLQK